MNDDKREAGDLTTDGADELIQAALASVEGEGRAAAAATESPDVQIEQLERDLREVRAQLDLSVERARETLDRLKDSHERHLRAAADLENYKKRAAREKEEVERFGTQRLLKDLLPVIDNLERALAHADATNPLAEGVAATRRIFEDTLGRHGMKSSSAVGQPFDPNKHEAMQQVETRDSAPGTVVSELVRGYTLHDRLVRPALVAVASAPARPAEPPAPAAEASVTPQATPDPGGENA